MKPWPWQQKVEKRSTSGYTAQYLNLLYSAATGRTINASGVDALETAASMFGSAFASATVLGSDRVRSAIGPRMLESIGRDLIQRGESTWAISVQAGKLTLIRASNKTVYGNSLDPNEWIYELWLPTPSGGEKHTMLLPATDTICIKYSTNLKRPWDGLGPLQNALDSGLLLGHLERLLKEESSGPSGYILSHMAGSVGEETQEESEERMKEVFEGLIAGKGATVTAELSSAPLGFNESKTEKPGFHTTRVGANYPEQLVMLRESLRISILAACGVPPSLVASSSSSDSREAYRQWVFARVVPLGAIAAEELSLRLGETISLDFQNLKASDTMGRSRAYSSLVGAGMDKGEASRICGFTREES